MNNTCHLTEPTFPLCCVDQWAGRSDEFGSTHGSLLPHTHTHSSQHDRIWPQREWREEKTWFHQDFPQTSDLKATVQVWHLQHQSGHTYTQRDLMCYSYIKDSDSHRSQFIGLLPFIFYILPHTLLQLKEATQALKGTVLKQSLIKSHSQTCVTFFHLRNANWEILKNVLAAILPYNESKWLQKEQKSNKKIVKTRGFKLWCHRPQMLYDDPLRGTPFKTKVAMYKDPFTA